MPRDTEPNWFPFYVDDFLSDNVVDCMNTTQVGAYLLLLLRAFREKPPASLPDDDGRLARWARLTPAEWQDQKDGVLSAWTLGKDGRWYQAKLRAVYDKTCSLLSKRAEAGRAGAAAKWQTHSNANGKRIAKPMRLPQQTNTIVVTDTSTSSGKGVQGETQPGPDPPEGTFSHLVPIAWDSLLDAWAGRRVMPLQVEMLGERIQRFGESFVKRALEMHVKAGKAHGNLTYLDKILEGGARDRGEVQQDEIARGIAKAVERQRRKRDGN